MHRLCDERSSHQPGNSGCRRSVDQAVEKTLAGEKQTLEEEIRCVSDAVCGNFARRRKSLVIMLVNDCRELASSGASPRQSRWRNIYLIQCVDSGFARRFATTRDPNFCSRPERLLRLLTIQSVPCNSSLPAKLILRISLVKPDSGMDAFYPRPKPGRTSSFS